MKIEKIGVVGAGIMGSGIAQVCATAGLDVVMVDISDEATQRGLAAIDGSLARQVKKEKITAADKAAVMARIRTSLLYQDLADRDLVVEAATENEALKVKILRDIDMLLPAGAILATNTSSYSITRLAAATRRPEQFVGMHFFNPVPMMALVEVIGGMRSSPEALAAVQAMAERLGKTPVIVKNSPGFVVNRILVTMLNEAIYAYQEGLASAEQIDSAMKLGTNVPLGPLELADLIGLDTVLSIMNTFYNGFNDPKYRPAPLLKEMVDAGCLGRKTGKGFHNYA